MSEKTRKKKDGRERNKDAQAMHEAVRERKENAGPEGPSTDEQDIITYKPGSGGDRNRRGAT